MHSIVLLNCIVNYHHPYLLQKVNNSTFLTLNNVIKVCVIIVYY